MYDLIVANLTDIHPLNSVTITAGAFSPFVDTSDLLDELRGLLYGADGLVSKKSGEVLTLFLVFLAPVVIIVGVVLAKIAYDLYTGAADSFLDALLIARFKIKSYIVSKLFPDR